MGFFTSILGKGKSAEKSKGLPPLPKVSSPVPKTVAKNMKTSYEELLQGETTPPTPHEVQRRFLAIPEVSMEDPDMQMYCAWVSEWADIVVDMHVPKNAPYPVNIHLKRGGIFYLEPTGRYFFPSHIFRFKDKKRIPGGYGFWIDASHCRTHAELSSFVRSNVTLVHGEDFYLPESTDEITQYKRGL